MSRYITNIHINKLYQLNNFNIPIVDENAPHLILTGKNGSGKTITLNAVADFLDKIKEDTKLYFLQYEEWLKSSILQISGCSKNSPEYIQEQSRVKSNQERYDNLYGKVNISFANGYGFINDYQEGNFIIAFYQAARKTEIKEPKNPTKPQIEERTGARMLMTNQ